MIVSKLNYLAKKLYLLNNLEIVTSALEEYYGDDVEITNTSIGKTKCIKFKFKTVLKDGMINEVESVVSRAIYNTLGFDKDFPIYSLFNISCIDSTTLLVEV